MSHMRYQSVTQQLLAAYGGGGGGGGDPHFASVVLLALNEDGADGTTTFTDASGSGHTITVGGNFQWDTAQAPTGLASSGLSDGTGDYLAIADSADFDVAAGDFTAEIRVRFASVAGVASVFGQRPGDLFGPWLMYRNGSNMQIYLSSNGSSWNIASAVNFGAVTTGAWYHLALNRTGTAFRAYKDGTGTAVATSSATLVNSSAELRIGANGAGNGSVNGWLAAARLTVGTGRYPSDFTPPSLPLPTS